jgi:uncharacterized protein YabN with tetrapyrrole methylase and pyrophosphatase domain
MSSDPQTAGEVLRNWDRIKREVEGEGSESGSDPFASIPQNLPALLYARKVLRRAEPEGGAPPRRGAERDAAEVRVGDLLLAAVDVARSVGVDPELALRAAADRHRERVGRGDSEGDA